jgi:hypothetical protein
VVLYSRVLMAAGMYTTGIFLETQGLYGITGAY